MAVFILTDATGTFWWLQKGGFSPIDKSLTPLAFKDEIQAREHARKLKQRFGFIARTLRLSAPGERKR